MAWLSKPDNAWRKYILEPNGLKPGWVEDSRPISPEIRLSKRELFALIILAYVFADQNLQWRVGFDLNDEEPNDGFIAKGKSKIRIEHKVVAQMQKTEVLEAILELYKKSAAKGANYGKSRILVIQINKESDHGGLIKISDLRKAIGNTSPFDKVFTLSVVATKGENNHISAIHLIQHYPPLAKERANEVPIIQVDFNFMTGTATIPYAGFVAHKLPN